MSPRPWTEADYKLADLMSDYWVNFATSGDPNAEGLPEWEAATPDNLKAMHFNTTSACGDLPSVELLKFLDKFYSN